MYCHPYIHIVVIVFLSEVISVTGRFLLISLGTGIIMGLGTCFK
jgi:hypothetical protein